MVYTGYSVGVGQPSRLDLLRRDKQEELREYVRRTRVQVLLVRHRRCERLACHVLESHRSLIKNVKSVSRSKVTGVHVSLAVP